MKIKNIISQNRRDFMAVYVCEHCGAEEKSSGYDDTYFHSEVIPNMRCKSCNEVSSSDYRPLTTKYPDSVTV